MSKWGNPHYGSRVFLFLFVCLFFSLSLWFEVKIRSLNWRRILFVWLNPNSHLIRHNEKFHDKPGLTHIFQHKDFFFEIAWCSWLSLFRSYALNIPKGNGTTYSMIIKLLFLTLQCRAINNKNRIHSTNYVMNLTEEMKKRNNGLVKFTFVKVTKQWTTLKPRPH